MEAASFAKIVERRVRKAIKAQAEYEAFNTMDWGSIGVVYMMNYLLVMRQHMSKYGCHPLTMPAQRSHRENNGLCISHSEQKIHDDSERPHLEKHIGMMQFTPQCFENEQRWAVEDVERELAVLDRELVREHRLTVTPHLKRASVVTDAFRAVVTFDLRLFLMGV
ncbi:hypothetical protein EXN66_Car010309 [Channa argus]|uniref:Uncharacterized protein n=1 Tax=Channa argus TaxID=215402 RepID=A0A6G1PWS6_CHAAH|nr:hypothetical protein EXN66_Car010309 [Channa argus]